MSAKKIGIISVAAVGLFWAASVPLDVSILGNEARAEATPASSAWSPTQPYPTQEVYYPGTETLAPDEMRVIACGSGMPMPRLKQAAACFLIELGNGEKFIFDLGTGSFTTLYALGMPLDYMTKIFLSHQTAFNEEPEKYVSQEASG